MMPALALLALGAGSTPQRFVVVASAQPTKRGIDPRKWVGAIEHALRYRVGLAPVRPDGALPSLRGHMVRCGADARCIADLLGILRADFAVRIETTEGGPASPAVAAVMVVSASTRQTEAESVVEAARERIVPRVAKRTADLFDQLGFRLGGRLAASGLARHARIELRRGSTVVARTIPRHAVAPGRYRLTIEEPERPPLTLEVPLRAGTDTYIEYPVYIAPDPNRPWWWAVAGFAGLAVGVTATAVALCAGGAPERRVNLRAPGRPRTRAP